MKNVKKTKKRVTAAALFALFLLLSAGCTARRTMLLRAGDAKGDDGWGALEYPEGVRSGSLDIAQFSAWQNHDGIIQAEVRFAKGGAARNIRICFGTEGADTGPVQSYHEAGGNLLLCEPWQYAVSVSNGVAELQQSDGSLAVPVKVSDTGRRILLTFSLETSERIAAFLRDHSVLSVYLLAGLYDRDGADFFFNRNGSPFMPCVYDVLDVPGKNQAEMLGSFSDEDLSLAVLEPVRISVLLHESDADSAAADSEKYRAELKEIEAQLAQSPDDSALVESKLGLLAVKLDEPEAALAYASEHQELLENSLYGNLYIAVAECKMAGIEKKVMDKMKWIRQGTERFDRIQRQWRENEDVYLYQAVTYSNFPSILGMGDDVLEKLSHIAEMYRSGAWQPDETDASLIWTSFSNLEKHYPKGKTGAAVREQKEAMKPVLEAVHESE